MDDIENFLYKYGRDTTNNFQLIHYAKDLGFKLHYAMRDELKDLKNKKLPLFIISNYHTSEQPGIHHVALYRDKDQSFYFDSYGIQPFDESIEFLEDGIYSTFKIQRDNTKVCGQLCLYVLYKLHNHFNFFDIILDLNDYFNTVLTTSGLRIAL